MAKTLQQPLEASIIGTPVYQRLLYVLEQKGLEDFPEGLRVKLAFSVEKEGFRPRCLRYDFSELIPVLFPSLIATFSASRNPRAMISP